MSNWHNPLRDRRLTAAIFMWKRGDDIPLDLEVYLLGEGIDVAALRHRYQKS